MSKFDKLALICAAALAMVACDASSQGRVRGTEGGAAPQAAASELGGDAWCDEFDEGTGASTDCALRVDEQRFVYLDYLTDEDGYASQMVLTQHSFAGDLLASSGPIDVEPVYGVAALRDLDGDALVELLIPLFAGNLNTVFSVWHQGADGLFVPAGEISSYGIDSLVARNGLVIAPSRGSAVAHYETASRFGAAGLETVYELEMNYESRTCRLTDESGLAAAGLDAATLIASCDARDW